MTRDEFFAANQLHLFIITIGGLKLRVFARNQEHAERKAREWLV